ncbi:MAG: DUF6263 family protein [Planctomycetes bacterium]|jgi:hypothetical protein|nr:DUF6263 family protein [Planctomycetota bacterium]
MAATGRLAVIAVNVLALVLVVVNGCQTPSVEAPARKDTAVGNAPAGAEPPQVGQDVVRGRTTHEETPHSAATSAVAPEVRPEPPAPAVSEPSGPAVELMLKFVSGRTATYRVTTEFYKSIEWKGAPAAKPAQFTNGRTGNHLELTFAQRVERVQDDGGAVLEITMRRLKHVIESVNKVVFDFDSARPQDANNPLAALIGARYQVKMSAQGQVLEISNVEPIRQAMQGALPGHQVARKLLLDSEIRSRHEIAALSAVKDRAVSPGQTWSSLKTFSFDDLGTKTYERVYTLGPVPSGGGPAVVAMKAIPSVAQAEGADIPHVANPLAKMSDNADSYTGRLVLDLDRGQVREYSEQMQNEWIIADPTSGRNPAAIRMAAGRMQRLELVQE